METLTTKNDNKNQKPPTASQDGAVAVYELRFVPSQTPDLGLDASGGSAILRAKEGREITYLPQRRFYRIVEASKGRKTKTIYIPEIWASFEPLE